MNSLCQRIKNKINLRLVNFLHGLEKFDHQNKLVRMRGIIQSDNPFYIEKPCFIYGAEFMSIGKNFYSRPGLRMECISSYRDVRYNPTLVIGDNVSFNFYCHVGVIDKVCIGNNVLIGSHVLITDHSHGVFDEKSKDIPFAVRKLHSKGPVIIEDNVWLCENSCVLPGVTIGKGSVIGANSVVTHDIPPYSLAIGAPAKIIRHL